ncbi:MAG: c-type cytochrome [Gammaproteobacteria bacterium]
MNKLILTIVATLLMTPAMAESEAEQLARTLCAGCHGPYGISTNDLWPNLAGQKAGYTAKQLRDYRDGNRNDPNMNALVQTFSDTQIEEMAAYYARQPASLD